MEAFQCQGMSVPTPQSLGGPNNFRHLEIFHLSSFVGYEPADLTVNPPPPRIAEGGLIFFCIGV